MASKLLQHGVRDIRQRRLQRKLAFEQQRELRVGLARFGDALLQAAQRGGCALGRDERVRLREPDVRARGAIGCGIDRLPGADRARRVRATGELGGAELRVQHGVFGCRRLLEGAAQVARRDLGSAGRKGLARGRVQSSDHPIVAGGRGVQQMRHDALGRLAVGVEQQRRAPVRGSALRGWRVRGDRRAHDRVGEAQRVHVGEDRGAHERIGGAVRLLGRDAGERRGVAQRRAVAEQRGCDGESRRRIGQPAQP